MLSMFQPHDTCTNKQTNSFIQFMRRSMNKMRWNGDSNAHNGGLGYARIENGIN